jgi:hypothetical protein
MARTLTTAGRDFPSWPKYALRITFGAIWLIDAVLKWLPGFRSGYLSMISAAGTGQPGWLRPWFSFWTSLQSPHPTVYAYVVAVLEQKVSWWWKLAEFGRPVQQQAAPMALTPAAASPVPNGRAEC